MYQSLIGALQWVIQIRRWDVSTAVMSFVKISSCTRSRTYGQGEESSWIPTSIQVRSYSDPYYWTRLQYATVGEVWLDIFAISRRTRFHASWQRTKTVGKVYHHVTFRGCQSVPRYDLWKSRDLMFGHHVEQDGSRPLFQVAEHSGSGYIRFRNSGSSYCVGKDHRLMIDRRIPGSSCEGVCIIRRQRDGCEEYHPSSCQVAQATQHVVLP